MEDPITVPVTPLHGWRLYLWWMLVALVAFLIFTAIEICISPFSGRFFDRSVWHEFTNDDIPQNPRAEMVHDLRWRHLHWGMDRSEVADLLGVPDYSETKILYSYNLGMWSGFGIDYDSLDVYFDKDGKLSRVRRVQH